MINRSFDNHKDSKFRNLSSDKGYDNVERYKTKGRGRAR